MSIQFQDSFYLKKRRKRTLTKIFKKTINEEFFNKVKTKIMEIRKYKIIVK